MTTSIVGILFCTFVGGLIGFTIGLIRKLVTRVSVLCQCNRDIARYTGITMKEVVSLRYLISINSIGLMENCKAQLRISIEKAKECEQYELAESLTTTLTACEEIIKFTDTLNTHDTDAE